MARAVLPMAVVPEFGIAQTGWVHLELPDSPEDLVVSYRTDDDDLGVVLVAVYADGTTQTASEWPVRLEQSGAVDLAIINMGAPEFDADDRLEMARIEISMEVVPEEPEPEDTGSPDDPDTPDDPDDDSDAVVDDDSPDDAGGGGASEVGGGDSDGKGGGCSVTGSATSWVALAGLMAVARRRKGGVAEEG